MFKLPTKIHFTTASLVLFSMLGCDPDSEQFEDPLALEPAEQELPTQVAADIFRVAADGTLEVSDWEAFERVAASNIELAEHDLQTLNDNILRGAIEPLTPEALKDIPVPGGSLSPSPTPEPLRLDRTTDEEQLSAGQDIQQPLTQYAIDCDDFVYSFKSVPMDGEYYKEFHYTDSNDDAIVVCLDPSTTSFSSINVTLYRRGWLWDSPQGSKFYDLDGPAYMSKTWYNVDSNDDYYVYMTKSDTWTWAAGTYGMSSY